MYPTTLPGVSLRSAVLRCGLALTGLLMSALIGLGAVRPAHAQAVGCTPSHVVQPGDNLYRIALAAGTSWPYLMQLNGIPNANLIYVGEVICLPGSVPGYVPGGPTPIAATPAAATPIAVTPGVPSTGIALPPAGIFPTIDFSTHSAAPGDTITLTGVNFPTNETADVYITPLMSLNAYTAVSQTVTSPTGTLNFAFAIPTAVNGAPLQGSAFSVLVKTRTTGYYGFNYFYNSRGY